MIDMRGQKLERHCSACTARLLCLPAHDLRRNERERSGLPSLAFAGGVAAAAFLLLSAVSCRVLSEPVVAQDAALAHAMLVASSLAGGPAISPGVPHRRRRPDPLNGSPLPRWIGRLGNAAVAMSVASP